VGVGPADVTGTKAVLVPAMLLATLPLAFRRRFPLAVLCVVMGANAAQGLLTAAMEGMAGALALVLAVYSLAAHTEWRRALAGLVIALVAAIPVDEDASDFMFAAFLIGARGSSDAPFARIGSAPASWRRWLPSSRTSVKSEPGWRSRPGADQAAA
jgi:hypothetical protein